ncbi:RNase E specificity factor CsrD [Thaumasiovibrio sp. DFM-14]|uniref:RNase E specificity factor CsrD n=1 Tax=Thaumasiovibrio sp. DFM-14 TaxID=3384792 RepID=UPI0039A27F90
MRKAYGMTLSNRLVAFVTIVVFAAMMVLFIGGAMSFRHLADNAVDELYRRMVEVIDEELEDPQSVRTIDKWLPKVLRSANVIEFELSNQSGSVFHYTVTTYQARTTLRQQRNYTLVHNPDLQVQLTSEPALSYASYSLSAMSTITLAILVVGIGIIFGVQWLKRQLHGSEVLETRGRMILAGRLEEYQSGRVEEWPVTASLALDQVITELQDARQERSRFDTFIRTHTFLDQLTGAANRVLFDSRLSAQVKEHDNTGAVILIQIFEFDEVYADMDSEQTDEFIKDVATVITSLSQRFPDSVLSRYFDGQFALLLANPTQAEVGAFINQLLKALEKLQPPQPLTPDNWCHVGVSYFKADERRGRIMDEANMALKSAQLQGTNSWLAFRKENQLVEGRGNVRWRTLFDHILEQEKIVLYHQPVFRHQQCIHHELLARIRDENGMLIKASRFLPAMKEVGYISRLDRFMLSKALKLLAQEEGAISINISVSSLSNRNFYRWFSQSLLECSRSRLQRLSIEISEASAVASIDVLRPVARLLHGLGVALIVDHAGRSVVSMHYIKELKPQMIKLHRSLVKDIHQRSENQLYIRSMLGSATNTEAEVVAVGVERDKEWRCLQQLGVNVGQGRLFGAELRRNMPD